MTEREPLDVIEAMQSMPARRYLKPDPIPDDILWEILDAAIRGPTGGNNQQWGWVVVRDPEIKQKIADSYRPILQSAYGHGRARPEDLTGGKRLQWGTLEVAESDVGVDAANQRAVLHLADTIQNAPVLVLPVIERAAAYNDTQAHGALLGSFIYGAVQNLMLAARAHGIGSVLTGGRVLSDISDINQWLGLPELAAVMALIPLGYPERGRWAQPKRRSVEQVTHWDRWGEQHTR